MTNSEEKLIQHAASQPISAQRRKKRRWGVAPTDDSIKNKIAPLNTAEAKAVALKQSISARLAALKEKKLQSETSSTRLTSVLATPIEPAKKKAKVYDLDLSVTIPVFREKRSIIPKAAVKENPYLNHLHLKSSAESGKEKEEIFNLVGVRGLSAVLDKKQLSSLDHHQEEILIDNRLAGGQVVKPRKRHKPLKFVKPGTYVELAEKKRVKAENAAKSGFMSGRKLGTFVKSTGMAHVEDEENNTDDYYGGFGKGGEGNYKLAPRADALEESADGGTAGSGGVVVIPVPLVMEWWDFELLPNKLKKNVINREGNAVMALAKKRLNVFGLTNLNGKNKVNNEPIKERKETASLIQKCFITASIMNCKTSKLIQHPVPILPPNAKKNDATKKPTLHLTKKETKRQRKLRRADRQRELQDMQAAGIIPPPKPRLTLSNFMRVLGDQAVLDPSKMELKVMEQMEARKEKHDKMNEAKKLTKEQRSAKRERKLTEDTSQSVTVALFVVKDTSHPYHRTKVDLNAQQRNITGGVLECEELKMSLVICEGGANAIKWYTRLMLVRMNWKGENILEGVSSTDYNKESGSEEDENGRKKVAQKFHANNTCELVWTGMTPKRMFNSFMFQSCDSSETARKVLEAKGVAHFWDQVLVHINGCGETFTFKLGDISFNEKDDAIDSINN